jgi:hypothetical protein
MFDKSFLFLYSYYTFLNKIITGKHKMSQTIASHENKYYVKWSKKKNRIIWFRSKFAHSLAISLAIFSMFREGFEHYWKASEQTIQEWILTNCFPHGETIILFLSWGWLIFILALIFATIGAALWELFGNKLDVSEQEKRFALGMKILLSKIEELKHSISKSNDVDTVNEIFLGFIDEFLRITSKVLCGEKHVHAGLMLFFPDENKLKLIKSTPNSGYPTPNELVIELDKIQERNEKGPAQLAFEKEKLAHMPKKSKKLGWLLQENDNDENYGFDTFVRGWFEVPVSNSKVFESVISVPITSYAKENKKAYHGVLNFTNEKKDHFIPRDYTMAFCFASIVAQAKDAASKRIWELEQTN